MTTLYENLSLSAAHIPGTTQGPVTPVPTVNLPYDRPVRGFVVVSGHSLTEARPVLLGSRDKPSAVVYLDAPLRRCSPL